MHRPKRGRELQRRVAARAGQQVRVKDAAARRRAALVELADHDPAQGPRMALSPAERAARPASRNAGGEELGKRL